MQCRHMHVRHKTFVWANYDMLELPMFIRKTQQGFVFCSHLSIQLEFCTSVARMGDGRQGR